MTITSNEKRPSPLNADDNVSESEPAADISTTRLRGLHVKRIGGNGIPTRRMPTSARARANVVRLPERIVLRGRSGLRYWLITAAVAPTAEATNELRSIIACHLLAEVRT